MDKGIPSFVWLMWLGLVGIELLVLMGIVSGLLSRSVPAGELAILGLLFLLIGLIIGGAAWLMGTYRSRSSPPRAAGDDPDFPVHGEA